METVYLKEFITLAESLSYEETAEKLFIAQSTLSRHIQRLEEELGNSLFFRGGRKVVLSSFGRSFLSAAKKAVAALESFSQEQSEQHHGVLRVCHPSSVTLNRILEVILDFQMQTPDLKLFLVRSANPMQDLLQEKIDLVITHPGYVEAYPKEAPFVREMELSKLRAEMFWGIPKDDPLMEREVISVEDLRNREIQVGNPFDLPDSELIYACQQAGIEPRIRHVNDIGTNYPAVAIQSVEEAVVYGMLTLQPAWVANTFSGHKIRFVPTEPKLYMNSSVLYVKGREFLPDLKKMLDYLSTYI